MIDQSSILKAIIGDRLVQALTAIVFLFGIATEAVVLYGQSREAAIKTEIAINAEKLNRAQADKTAAEAEKAAAVAIIADIRQKAEARYKTQQAIVETAIAKYAERMKRAEADKLQAEAASEIEIAKNSEVQQRAEAQKAEMEGLKASADAAISQWVSNCQIANGASAATAYNCNVALYDTLIGGGALAGNPFRH